MEDKFYSSDNPTVIAKGIKKQIEIDSTSDKKAKMKQGLDYYNQKHEILDYQMLYIDKDGIARLDNTRSNIKISHGYFTENVEQTTQYLLSNPVKIVTSDENLKGYLKPYIDESFQSMLQRAVEGCYIKGKEYVYVLRNEKGLIDFMVADAIKVIEVYDDFNKLVGIIRYYDKEIVKDGKNVIITKAEFWDNDKVYYFVRDKTTTDKEFKLDSNYEINPKPHVIVQDEEGTKFGKGFGFIPFYKLLYKDNEHTGLEPIKGLIDDYDLMACALSNNLSDFDQPFFAVKGFSGSNYEELLTNLKSRGAVGVGENGGIDLKTVNIPVEARRAKLEVDKEGIYKFGMAFDSTQLGDGNITNIVIKSRYSLLDLKCNKLESSLRTMIRWMLELIVEDINLLHNTAFNHEDLAIEITRDTMVNESDNISDEKTAAETKNIILQSILDMAPQLDDETVVKMICETYDLDYNEVVTRLNQQDYESKGESDNEEMD